MSDAPEGTAPAGWYPDPNGQMRWWDGQQWGQVAAPAPAVGGASATDPKTLAMLAQLLGIFTGWIGPLIIYLMNGEKDPFVRHHAAEALNFHITVFIAYVVCFVLIFLIIGIVLLPILMIGALVLEIMATVAAHRGEWYRYPISIRLVPGAIGA